MTIAFFGSSLVSAYWNGAATYYRGLIHALYERGHEVTFYEPDAFDRQKHRDLDDPHYARSVIYPADDSSGVREALESARSADLVVKASGVGVFDEFLEERVLDLQNESTLVAFWDVDAPATLDRVEQNPGDPFRSLIPRYDVVFTYGGGPPVVEAYERLEARKCVPVYNALDPDTHHPSDADPRFDGALAFLGNRMPDREERVDEFFLQPARRLSDHRFLLGGSGWGENISLPNNVDYLGHVYTRDHNAFNSAPLAVLNINRESMARYGFSPATRIFEAAGAGACLITDAWKGLDRFLDPGSECLVARSGDEVVAHLRVLTSTRANEIGEAARRRLLSEHTYKHRAEQVENVLDKMRASTVEVVK